MKKLLIKKLDRSALLLVIVLAFFLTPLMHPGLYASHDSEAHVIRFGAYYKAFQDGQFPPRWAGDLHYRYGSPVFIFFYPLPGYIGSLLHGLGFSLESTFKIMGVSFVLGPLFFYYWIKHFVKGASAWAGGLLYGLAPYHLLDMYVRGDVAEILSFVFIPLVFLFFELYFRKKQSQYIIFAGFAYAMLILSHNGVSLMFSPVLVLYVLVRKGISRVSLVSFGAMIMGLCLSSFFWIPALYESKYANAKLFIGDMYRHHFPSIGKLIYSFWGFGPDVNKIGGLSPQIGIVHLLLVAIGIVIFWKKKEVHLLFWLIIFSISIFITTSPSAFLWQHLPLLKLYQFPWRFVALSSFSSAVVGAWILNKTPGKMPVLIITLMLIVTSLSFVHVQSYVIRNDAFYFNSGETTSYHGEASSIWTAGDFSQFPKKSVEVVAGSAQFSNLKRKSNLHTFSVNALSDSTLVDNTVYFPGWKAEVDGKKQQIEFQDENYRGLITFVVPKGQHAVRVFFTESPVRMLANIFSLLSLLAVSILLGMIKLREHE